MIDSTKHQQAGGGLPPSIRHISRRVAVYHCVKRLVRKCYRYLFVRRLAIKPPKMYYDSGPHGYTVDSCEELKLFEWQKMPQGFRYF